MKGAHSYMGRERAPTHKGAPRAYSGCMNEGIYFADAELPFHVWVRQRTGDDGFRWVLRETHRINPAEAGTAPVPPEAESGGGAPGGTPA